MKHLALMLGVAAGLAAPAAAQWLGEPVWNSPTGGGFTISADYAKPNTNYGSGTAWGARLAFGTRSTTFTIGGTNWTPEGTTSLSFTSIGGNVAVQLTGASLLPTPSPGIRVNLQLGVAHADVTNAVYSFASTTTVTGALGLGAWFRSSSVTLEPYISPGFRYRYASVAAGSNTDFGYAIGANVGFGSFGVHFAYDNEAIKGGGTVGVFGLGAHLTP